MTTLNRFLALPVHARLLLVAAAALQVSARVALRCGGLPAAVDAARWLGRRRPGAADLSMLRWALAAAARRVGGTCLTQALAACALGASPARPARLVIGARPRAGGPEFHAWAEIAGMTLPSTSPRAFARMKTWI